MGLDGITDHHKTKSFCISEFVFIQIGSKFGKEKKDWIQVDPIKKLNYIGFIYKCKNNEINV